MPAQLKRRLFIFLLIVLLIAGGFFAQWFFKGRFYESTDNAYVQGEITRVSSQLGATSRSPTRHSRIFRARCRRRWKKARGYPRRIW